MLSVVEFRERPLRGETLYPVKWAEHDENMCMKLENSFL